MSDEPSENPEQPASAPTGAEPASAPAGAERASAPTGPRPASLVAAAVLTFVVAAEIAGWMILEVLNAARVGEAWGWSVGGPGLTAGGTALYFAWSGRQLLRRDKAAYVLLRAMAMMGLFGTLYWVLGSVAYYVMFGGPWWIGPAPSGPVLYGLIVTEALDVALLYLLNAPQTRIAVGEKPTGGTPLTLYVSRKAFVVLLVLAVPVSCLAVLVLRMLILA